MTIPLARMSVIELVAHVQSHLERAGIRTVLSGGTCVTIWSANAYRSDDIDLIPDGIGQRTRIRTAMLALGFAEERRYFVHHDTTMFVEFPAGPLSVGEERPREVIDLVVATGTARVLSPTDSVKDRLTWWFHHGDRQCLEQAVAIATTTGIDVDEVRRWAAGEGKADAFRSVGERFARPPQEPQ